jgi:E3 ubiquitin-protein ligase RNF14
MITLSPSILTSTTMRKRNDERTAELDYLQASYPDESFFASGFSGYVELPIVLQTPLELDMTHGTIEQCTGEGPQQNCVSSLPPIRIEFTLPDEYPDMAAPQVNLQATVSWLPQQTIVELEEFATRLWEDYDRARVLCTYIDDLYDRSMTAFGLSRLEVTAELRNQLLYFDQKAEKEQFNRATYECGVCLDAQKGSSCHRMDHCGHVFCIECLQSCYTNAILTGDMAEVKCMAFNCGTENDSVKTRREKRAKLISPSELLRIPMPRQAVQRYVNMKRKRKLETDQSIAWCPRKWCRGAAASKKYPKPLVPLEDMDEEYEAKLEAAALPQATVTTTNAEVSEQDEATKDAEFLQGRLQVCEDCYFAFCNHCKACWHGDHYDCRPRTESLAGRAQISKEEQASQDFILQHTTTCPTCKTAVQKTEACNHISCAQYGCYTHFCYLCAEKLIPGEPYQHYSTEGTSCYGKLWALQDGDDGQVNDGFGGARGAELAARQAAAETADPTH